MRTPPWRLARRSVGALLVALAGGLVSLAMINQGAGLAGLSRYVIHGGSMEPAIALGALILVAEVDPATIHTGDVITVRADTGVVYSHRVVAVTGSGASLQFQTRGDANVSPDPRPAPGRAIVGRVAFTIPMAGFVLAFFDHATGIICVLSLFAALALAYSEVADLEAAGRRRVGALTPQGPIQRRKAAA
jgi:signal peptidase I